MLSRQIPDDFFVDTEIVMYQEVSKPDDPRPLDICPQPANVFRQSPNSLSDHLQIPHDSVKADLVLRELVE